MKKILRSVTAIFLALLMLVPIAVPASAASGAAVPTVYCQGQGAGLLNAQGEQIYPFNLPDGYIMSVVEECMPLFIDAVTTGAYDAWYAKLQEEVIPLFEDIQLDNNGEIANNTRLEWTWSYNNLKGKAGTYYLRDYVMQFDWRLDPFTNADRVHEYVTAVMAKTGADKVNLVGRCEGANIVMAYLVKYGYEHVNCVEFYVQSLYGVDAASAAFSGNIEFDSSALEDWLDANVDLEDELLTELLYSFISLAQATFSLPVLAQILNLFADKLYNDGIMPELVLHSFGTFPGIWALVNSEDYEQAKEVVFAGREEEYAGLIEKIDYYDVNVRQRVNEIIAEAQNAGVKFASISKYGYVSIPLDKTASELSDSTVTLAASTFGATCAPRGAVLSDSYIASLEKSGKDVYLSPDKNIDASTALFPDTVWIIKDSDHKNFPDCEHALMEKFMHSDGTMTVFTDENYPQYMVFDADTQQIAPYEGSPQEDVVEKPMSIKDYCLRFVNAILAFFYRILNNWFASDKAE